MMRLPLSSATPSPSAPPSPASSTVLLSRRGFIALVAAGVGSSVRLGSARAEPVIELPKMRSEIRTFPDLPVARPQHVPPDEDVLFYVQHSINDNVIVYAAKRTATGGLDPKQPIDVFWRRFATSGRRRELSFFERWFAFGVSAEPAGAGRWSVELVSWRDRGGVLDTAPDGRPRLLVPIGERPMRPVYVYAEAVADGFIPTIRHIDVFAVADDVKGYVRERVHFG